jgi:hypothetical protein
VEPPFFYRPSPSWSDNDGSMVTDGKQCALFVTPSKNSFTARGHPDAKAARRRVDHFEAGVKALGVRVQSRFHKTRNGLSPDSKSPMSRQQVADSAC